MRQALRLRSPRPRAAREPLAIVGNATKAGMLRPVQAARSLSTRNLSGITLYSPNELIISARAGTPLAEIEAALAEHGQHIIAEPADLAAITGAREQQTLGGVIATNLSGPRRVAWGAMRDHVLGIRAVTGHGEAIHSGGRVLKNVTGLDLCKLLTGSHGTLAVITEVTLKVLPAPEAVGTVVLPGLDATAGVAALSAALGSPYSVSAAAWLPARCRCPHPGARRFRPACCLGPHRRVRCVGGVSHGQTARRPQARRHRNSRRCVIAYRVACDARPHAVDGGSRLTRSGAFPCARQPDLSCCGHWRTRLVDEAISTGEVAWCGSPDQQPRRRMRR